MNYTFKKESFFNYWLNYSRDLLVGGVFFTGELLHNQGRKTLNAGEVLGVGPFTGDLSPLEEISWIVSCSCASNSSRDRGLESSCDLGLEIDIVVKVIWRQVMVSDSELALASGVKRSISGNNESEIDYNQKRKW